MYKNVYKAVLFAFYPETNRKSGKAHYLRDTSP